MSDGPVIAKTDEVIDWLVSRVLTINTAAERKGVLVESKYRIPVADEPTSSLDGRFYVDVERGGRFAGMQEGSGENVWEGLFCVYVGYYAGGGAGTGDRKTVARRAGADMQTLGDVCEVGLGIEAPVSECECLSWERSQLGADWEVWKANFRVQWRSAIVYS